MNDLTEVAISRKSHISCVSLPDIGRDRTEKSVFIARATIGD